MHVIFVLTFCLFVVKNFYVLEFNNCVCKFDKNKNKNLLKKKKKEKNCFKELSHLCSHFSLIFHKVGKMLTGLKFSFRVFFPFLCKPKH